MQNTAYQLINQMFVLEHDIALAEIEALELEQFWQDGFFVGNESDWQQSVLDSARKNGIRRGCDWLARIQNFSKQIKNFENQLHDLLPLEKSSQLLYLSNDGSQIHFDDNYSISNDDWLENMLEAKQQALEILDTMTTILIHNQEVLAAAYPEAA